MLRSMEGQCPLVSGQFWSHALFLQPDGFTVHFGALARVFDKGLGVLSPTR